MNSYENAPAIACLNCCRLLRRSSVWGYRVGVK
jgi:hypothetical protein